MSSADWQAIAEHAARARCKAILERIKAAIAEHAPNAKVEAGEGSVRARGRGLRRRWISEPGLRFARRIGR
jgi:hypothetical protein